MKVVFFGTPRFAKEILDYLLKHRVDVVAVVTQEDKPKGRSRKLQATEVKEFVQGAYPHIPVFQPKKASDPLFVEKLRTYEADLFIVVCYGQLLKQNLLDLPKILAINVHPSLLPLYRGAAPIRSPLLNGDLKTGVTIMEMALEMDAGDILAQEEFPIPDLMTHGELEEHLCHLSCALLLSVVEKVQANGSINKTPQDHAKMTITKKTTPEDLRIDFSKTAREVHGQIRAFSPSPGAYADVEIDGKRKRIKIMRSEITNQLGTISSRNISFDRVTGWVVSCSDLGLKILQVQPEGGRSMMVKDFMNGVSQVIFISS